MMLCLFHRISDGGHSHSSGRIFRRLPGDSNVAIAGTYHLHECSSESMTHMTHTLCICSGCTQIWCTRTSPSRWRSRIRSRPSTPRYAACTMHNRNFHPPPTHTLFASRRSPKMTGRHYCSTRLLGRRQRWSTRRLPKTRRRKN